MSLKVDGFVKKSEMPSFSAAGGPGWWYMEEAYGV